MPIAYIGLGSNLAGPQQQIRTALAALAGMPALTVQRVSRLYVTPPWGETAQPDFVNAVAEIGTTLPPRELLTALLQVERTLGRVRNQQRWGPRIIDLDLLHYADVSLDEPGLQLPHPRIQERAFVLLPLCELAPTLRIAGFGTTAELCERIDGTACRILE